MSQVIIEAVGLLRSVVEKIDARLTEMEFEQSLLLDKRAKLVLIIDGEVSAADPAVAAFGRQFEAAARTEPAKPVPPPASPRARGSSPVYPSGSICHVDGAARIETALAKKEPLRWPEVLSASRIPTWKAKRLVNELIAAGRLVRTGSRSSTRYSLPTGRAKRGPATAAQGKPADDDSHGVSCDDISAGVDAGMSRAPSDAMHPPAAVSRPPVAIAARTCLHCGEPFEPRPRALGGTVQVCCSDPCQTTRNRQLMTESQARRRRDDAAATPAAVKTITTSLHSEESLGKGSIAHGRETDDVDDEDEDEGGLESHEDEELPADVDALDLADEPDAAVDEEPTYRKRPGPKPKYKPGHRQLDEGQTSTKGSWWLRPDADFAAEAERMRLDPKQKKTPGENNILCMKGAF